MDAAVTTETPRLPDDSGPLNGGGNKNVQGGGGGGQGGRRGNNNNAGGGGGRSNRGGQNRFAARGAGPNQNFRGNRQSQQDNGTDNPGDVTLGGDQPTFPPQQQQQHNNNNSHNNNYGNQRDRHQKGQNQRYQRGNGGGEEYLISQRLSHLQGPTHDIPTIQYEEIKFSGRNRLYVGNLTGDATEEELKDLFKQFGEVSEIFLNTDKFFAFIRVDYRVNAEKAKRELDGYMRCGRALRVRFAPNATTVRVKNLTQHVSNELLYRSFEIFGQVERAVIVVDERGRPSGEGIVEFSRKSAAMAAIHYCKEKCYFLTSSLRPCVCDLFEHTDDTDGYPEKVINKKNQEFFQSRQLGPRFAEFNSFEHEYGTRWKQLHELYQKKHDALTTEMKMEEEKLEAQMEYARYEHETELLRNQLRMREQDREQVKNNWEMKEKFADEQRIKSEEQMRRTQEEMQQRMGKQEDELRRRQQENTLFMQAQHMNQQMIDQQSSGMPMNPNLNMDPMNQMVGGVPNGLNVGGGGNNNPMNMPVGMDMDLVGGGGVPVGLGSGNGPIGMCPNNIPGIGGPPNVNHPQQQQRQKNFNGPNNNRNFQQQQQQVGNGGIPMVNQDDGGTFNNFGGNINGGGGGGGNPNNRNNQPGNRNRQWIGQQQPSHDGGGGNGNFQNKRRRF